MRSEYQGFSCPHNPNFTQTAKSTLQNKKDGQTSAHHTASKTLISKNKNDCIYKLEIGIISIIKNAIHEICIQLKVSNGLRQSAGTKSDERFVPHDHRPLSTE